MLLNSAMVIANHEPRYLFLFSQGGAAVEVVLVLSEAGNAPA